MPSCNSEKYICQSIDSVISQTYQNWELVISDDHSSDSTYNIVEEYSKRDKRIKLFRNTGGRGAAHTRNLSIEKAKGRYIAFLDSDDLWYPNYLELRISHIEQEDLSFTYSYYEKINMNGNYIGDVKARKLKVSYSQLLYSNVIGCLTAIYDTKKIGKVYMPIMNKRQDFGLWLKILRQVDYAYCYPTILAKYRVQKKSVSSNKLSLLKYNWAIYRNVAGLNVALSAYYMTVFLLKYFFNKFRSFLRKMSKSLY
jgi:glycosyltransferase involved in cell wall biosynthesis